MSDVFDGRLLAQIQALNVPHPEDVVLNSSGALAEQGVIPIESVSDIDACMSEENLLHLQQRIGWHVTRRVVGVDKDQQSIYIEVTHDDAQRFDFHRWDFSLFDYNRFGRGRISLDTQKDCSIQDPVTGIWVATVDYVKRTKLETGREKDIERLNAIARYETANQ